MAKFSQPAQKMK